MQLTSMTSNRSNISKLVCVLALSVTSAAAGTHAFAQDQANQGQKDAASRPESTNPDIMFVHKAAEGGLLEVQLGQLASQKAQNSDVQAFGQKMVTDHTMLNEKMMPVAQSLDVKPPSHLNRKDQAEYDKLNALSGSDFDKAYVEAMVKDHRMDLREFRNEEKTTTNPQLKEVVQQAEQVIAEHHRMIDHIAQQMGLPVGGAASATTQTPSEQ